MRKLKKKTKKTLTKAKKSFTKGKRTELALECVEKVQGGFLRRVRRAARRAGRGLRRAGRGAARVGRRASRIAGTPNRIVRRGATEFAINATRGIPQSSGI